MYMYLRTVCVTSVLAHCTVIHSGYRDRKRCFRNYFCSGVLIEAPAGIKIMFVLFPVIRRLRT